MNNTQTSTIATLCGIPSSYVVHFAMTRDVRIASLSNTVFSDMSIVCPNAYSVSQILKDYGYTLVQIQGYNNNFANTKLYLELHGFDIIEGLNELKSNPLIKHPFTGWGISDSDLFNILKEKANFLSQKQPFFLYCITNDTHAALKETEQTVTKDFQKASKLAFNFVQWVQAQDFAQNTVIIIVGDHLRIDHLFQEIPNRTIYNVFINSQATPPSKNRTF